MMVTFVSQCEKNALKRTRRVLDAFANRIGDNTWQTVITQEGLLAVKKLLRKTASKSTAVSCHWIRSRSRSELVWVVGRKDRFNTEGVVPVNYTEVIDIKQDEIKIMSEIIYANSHKQLLSHHLFAVGYVAALMVDRLFGEECSALRNAAFVSGCLHDIGKLDPEFRNWVNTSIKKNKKGEIVVEEDGLHIDKAKFSFEKHPRHNEISLWLAQFIDLSPMLANSKLVEHVEHAIYWHHAKPIRQDEYTKVNDIHRKLKSAYKENGLGNLVDNTKYLIKQVTDIADHYDSELVSADFSKCEVKFDENIADSFRNIYLPPYKQYEPEEELDDFQSYLLLNAKNNILRACVVGADRKVSELSSEELSRLIETSTLDLLVDDALSHNSDLVQQVQDCLLRFDKKYPNSERNLSQATAAKALLDAESVAVLNGPAGCGKTKIALEWAKLSEAKKIIWVCPRVQVCEGLYQDLTAIEYLQAGQIEICTGELKFINDNGEQTPTPTGKEFSGDIVLTTIDQVINSITTHSNITAFVDFLNSHVVFDEYHEYIPMPAFNLLFSELIQAKKLMGGAAKTLLVSATPHYSFVDRVLDIDEEDIVDVKSFNNSRYQIDFSFFDETCFDDTNPLFSPQPTNTIVISNTATTAQKAFIYNQNRENAIVFHGKFLTKHKQEIFKKVFDSFKWQGTQEYDVLRSGPIVQASLNITCNFMTSEFTLAENFLQRLGRLDRFGESEETNHYTVAVPESISMSNGKIKGNCAKFLNRMNCYRSAYAWFEFLQSKQPLTNLTINEIYQLYLQFYQSNTGKKALELDLLVSLKESVGIIAKKIHDPIRYIKKPKATDKKKLKKTSLRGDSRFVQMAIVTIESADDFTVTDDYASTWQENNSDFSNCYTESLNLIRGSGLIDYVAKKHGRIDPLSPIAGIPANKMNLRKQVLEGAAIDAATPIFLSYTPTDLAEKLGESSADESAIYYVIGNNQIIGAMSLNQLKQS